LVGHERWRLQPCQPGLSVATEVEGALKVLIAAEGSVERVRLARIVSSWELEVVECATGDEAWRYLLGEDAVRLAVLDWLLPGLTAADLCRAIRNEHRRYYTYVVVATDSGRDEALAALDAGADDYVVKPVQLQQLRARLRVGRRILALQDGLMEMQERLRERSERDDLTGLLNRGSVLHFLEREIARCRRESRPLSVVIGDLDHFKAINDSHGHLAGDTVLKAVAARMNEALRSYDGVGRVGGEEFLVVLPNSDAAEALRVAERVRVAVGGDPIEVEPGKSVVVTMTLGVASLAPGTAVSADALIRWADRALYAGKAAGRDRVAEAELAATT
jgi:diguanylate cyclase (GGDEF)-like protein